MAVSELVSVVMPTYNSESTVERALRSVLAQTHDALEVLVVDDGSTDGTREVVAAVGDERVRTRVRKSNSGGPSTPRNEGIERTTGAWLAFIDHDDEWFPDKLERQLELAQPDVDLIYSRCVRRDDDTGLEEDFHERIGIAELPVGRCLEPLIERDFVPVLTAMIRRGWTQRTGGFRHDGVDDYDLWLRMALMGAKFAALDAQTARYHWNRDNLSHRVDWTELQFVLFRDLVQDFPEQRSLLTPALRRARRRRGIRRLAEARREVFGGSVPVGPQPLTGAANAVRGLADLIRNAAPRRWP